jgi:DNA-binding response OmpR family regulator
MSTVPVVRPCCLIVEDQVLIAMSVEAYLEDEGFDVETTTSASQAQAWLEEAHTPAYAIVDFMLKDGPATALAEELRRRGVPFVVYSGYPRTLDISSDLAAVPWLEKPTTREDLLRELLNLRSQPPSEGIPDHPRKTADHHQSFHSG